MIDPIATTTVRIRFSGSKDSETFHLTPKESDRLHSDWMSFLTGQGVRGGEYVTQDADHQVVVSLNFSQIAFTEPGKLY